jgi:endonuclease G, mitochondrial
MPGFLSYRPLVAKKSQFYETVLLVTPEWGVMKTVFTLGLFLSLQPLAAQTIEQQMTRTQKRIDSVLAIKIRLDAELEQLKLSLIRRQLQDIGLPKATTRQTITWHSAMALEYAEPYEQARWVAHIITYDVVSGTALRSNDFRPDSSIATGSAMEADYFLKLLQPDSSYKYDGFGYDRGHLAPSADFRWSAKALSESYLYSNMSPQRPVFNRETWGDLEDKIRGYCYGKPGVRLYVVTGPVLQPGLPKIERGVNKVSIPKFYWKVVLDAERKRSIGFVMPNQAITVPLSSFAVSVDSVEKLTGLDFFNALPDAEEAVMEKRFQLADWLPAAANGDVEPLAAETLKRGQINTLIARDWMNSNREVSVCGTVVSARVSRAGNILLNLDKQFPNQVFTVFIKKEFISNFAYDPVNTLKGKVICVTGRVQNLDGLPAMFIESGKDLKY